MRTSALYHHLRHPLTYSDAQRKTQHLSAKQMTGVTIVVLASLALGTAEAIKSNRSLKSSLVTIGVLTGVLFYLTTAIMKMASQGEGSSARKDVKPPVQEKEKTTEKSFSTKKAEVGSGQTPKPELETLLVSVVGSQDKMEFAVVDGSQAAEDEKKPQVTETATPQVQDTLLVSMIGSSEKMEFAVMGDSSEPEAKEETLPKNLSEWVVTEDPPLVCPVQEKKLYEQLTLTLEESTVIRQLLHAIGNSSVFSLYLDQDQLLSWGKCIVNVHPLKFLETALNNRANKESMLKIKDSYFKWRGFLNGDSSSKGFIYKCQEADFLQNIEPYLDDFCKVVNADAQRVRAFYKAQQWKELIEFLFES